LHGTTQPNNTPDLGNHLHNEVS